MFGVMLVRTPEGQLAALKAFSGQLERRWDVDGFVPPVFDRGARAAVEPRGEACVRNFTARVMAARDSAPWAEARAAKARLDATHAREDEALRARRGALRATRQAARAALGPLASAPHLDASARQDELEHRSVKTRMRQEREPLEAALSAFERRYRRVQRLRVVASRVVSRQLYDSYIFRNSLQQVCTLRQLFAPGEPPAGTGDCAAPKLIVFALRHGLQPLSLAEFWWGRPPRNGSKTEGQFYTPCKDKCGPLLAFLMAGIDPVFAAQLGYRTSGQPARITPDQQ